MLRANNIKFGGIYMPKNSVSFQLNVGEILLIMGPSGIGKTTLLNILAGFNSPCSGELTWNGKNLLNLPVWERPISFLFQEDNLFEHLNCRTNLRFSFSPSARVTRNQDLIIDQTLKEFGILHLIERMPRTLSGGEQQRIALARAILKEDPIILLDEPFSALDDENRSVAIDFVANIAQKHHRIIIAVSHNYLDVEAMGASCLNLFNTKLD